MSEENKNLPKVENKENNEEKGSKKRDIIKNVAIIFLAVMLLLTFFSNTIMNYSLAQVSTESIESGTIKAQVRGKGTIELVDPYNVIVDETRTIASVRVKVGDEVKEGDVIYMLEGIESDELATAKKDLRDAEQSFLTGLLSGEITLTNNSQDIASIQNAINSLNATIDARQADIDKHQNNVNMLQYQIDALGTFNAPDTKGYDNEIAAQQANIDKWTEEQKKYQDTDPEYAELSKKISDAELKKIEINYNKTVAGNASDPNKAKKDDLANQLKVEEQGIVLSKKAKEDAETNLKRYVTEMTGQVKGYYETEKLNELREKVAKLEAKATGSEIKSPVNGKIVTVSKQAGEKTEAKETVAVIQVEGKGLCAKISVDARQANKVKVGDPVTIEDYYYYGCSANLAAIQPDTDDPKNKKTLLFDLIGEDFEAGGTVSLAVGQANQSYNLTMPKSALREDSKGKYILTLESKAVPFGTRYIAKRVDVTEVYAEDDTKVAVEAAVEPWGTYVITNQTKPIKNGDQVRLATEESK